MQAFVLAGGFATRLWPLTERRAKPLLPLAGKPILTYLVESIPDDLPVTVSTNAVFADDFQSWRTSLKRNNVTVSIEDAGHEDQKLGALGAVAKWITEKKIDDDILLLAGDNYADFKLSELIAKFRGNPIVAGHDIGDTDLARRFGTIVLNGESVSSFEEKPAHPKSTIVSTGWSVIPKALLGVLTLYAAKHPDNIGGIFEEFLRLDTDVDCVIFKGLWKDIGSFESYMSLHREIVGEKTLADPSASFSADSTLGGSVDLGPKTIVKKSTLNDCILFGNSTINDCVLTRCIIDTGCTLEGIDLTDQMLRAGTILKRF